VVSLRDPLGSVAKAEAAKEQIEIGFVPVSERRHTTSTFADTIISVGQRSQQKKKRKRNPASNGVEAGVETFDHTVEPSLLDEGDVKEVGPVTKKRNKGKRIWLRLETEYFNNLTRSRTN
jgi:hypothetical protein